MDPSVCRPHFPSSECHLDIHLHSCDEGFQAIWIPIWYPPVVESKTWWLWTNAWVVVVVVVWSVSPFVYMVSSSFTVAGNVSSNKERTNLHKKCNPPSLSLLLSLLLSVPCSTTVATCNKVQPFSQAFHETHSSSSSPPLDPQNQSSLGKEHFSLTEWTRALCWWKHALVRICHYVIHCWLIVVGMLSVLS